MEHLTVHAEAPCGPLPWMMDERAATSSNWRQALPVLIAPGVTLRNLRVDDAASLLAMLSTEEVSRFISPPPTTVDAFEHFIKWALQQQAAGRYTCFAIVPAGSNRAVGLIQFRNLGDNYSRAEWGFAVGSPYWGTGLFINAARSALDFAFATLGVERLEARCVVENGRGTGALRKLGAVAERHIAEGLVLGEKKFDQYLWTLDRASHAASLVPCPLVTPRIH